MPHDLHDRAAGSLRDAFGEAMMALLDAPGSTTFRWNLRTGELTLAPRWAARLFGRPERRLRLSAAALLRRSGASGRAPLASALASLEAGVASVRLPAVRLRAGAAGSLTLEIRASVLARAADGGCLEVAGLAFVAPVAAQSGTGPGAQAATPACAPAADAPALPAADALAALLTETTRMARLGSWQVDLATGDVQCCGEFLRLHGLPVGRAVRLDDVAACYAPALGRLMRDLADGTGRAVDDRYVFETRLRPADGSPARFVQMTGRIDRRDGVPVRLTGCLQDVGASAARQQRIVERERILRRILEQIPARICYVDADRFVRFANRGLGQRLRRNASDLVGLRVDEVPDLDLDPQVIAGVRTVLEGQPTRFQVDEVRDGRPHVFEVRMTPDLRHDGTVHGLIATAFDVTELQSLGRELQRGHALLSATLQTIREAVVTTDVDGIVQWMNPAAERLTGIGASQAIGVPADQVLLLRAPGTRSPVRSTVQACLAGGRTTERPHEAILIGRDGAEHGVEETSSPIRDAAGALAGAVTVLRDVTERQQLSAEVSRRSRVDPLTGLDNRMEFEVRLGELLARSREQCGSHVVMQLNLDRFKLVNEACGVNAGNEVLCRVAGLLWSCVGARTGCLARLGGDEYGVLLEGCTQADAIEVAGQITEAIDEYRYLAGERRFRVGVSIGLVAFDGRWSDVGALLGAVDAACQAAKNEGRQRIHVWGARDEDARHRNDDTLWAHRIERALEEGRFVLYAQRIEPVRDAVPPPSWPPGVCPPPGGAYAAGDGAHGLHFEVLLRMVGEDGAIIPPGRFIPAAERFHLASRIDRWVLDRVVDLLEADPARAQSIDLVAVNLSGQSIGDASFLQHTLARLRRARCDLRRLCLEVTETAAVTNLREAAPFIAQLREIGVRIALDDFGAGASSFGYLKHLPIDILKIDGQFIRDMTGDRLNRAAVRCFQEVANVLGVQTIAEFVERPDILVELARIGVDFAQGYLLHQPGPIDELLRRAPAGAAAMATTAVMATAAAAGPRSAAATAASGSARRAPAAGRAKVVPLDV